MKALKAQLKEWAVEIRRLKSLRKEYSNGYVSGLEPLRYKYRHFHIAYCELRGTPYEKIERKTNSGPYRKYIEDIMERFTKEEEKNEADGWSNQRGAVRAHDVLKYRERGCEVTGGPPKA